MQPCMFVAPYSNSLAKSASDASEKLAMPLTANCNEIVHCGLLSQMAKLPDQPENVLPTPAVAVNVTLDAAGKIDVQLGPQSMPAGSLVTLPVPLPPRLTLSVN